MKITAIKQQVKRADRYSVYVDGQYVCSFSESELLKLGLRSGQELTKGELERLKSDSVKDKAYMRAIDLISRRPRSEWEMCDYLRRKDYDEEIIDEVLNKLTLNKLINDEEFAGRWVENRRLLKSVSQRRLRQELKQKRIADEIINRALEKDQADERETLRELIAKKRHQTKYQDDLKLKQFLARQGFGYDDIRAVMAESE